MLSRPVNDSGDILPVLSSADICSSSVALAAGLRDHLNFFPGDWWEYITRGNEIFDLVSASRRTARDAETLASYLCDYIRSFPDVQSLSDVHASFENRCFSFSCIAHTVDGETVPVSFAEA